MSTHHGCHRYSIPAGVLTYVDDNGVMQTLDTSNLVSFYETGCSDDPGPTFFPTHTPFSWSAAPTIFTLSGITTTSWLLLILLNISKRRRPWLQKLAILVLSVSLTAILSRLTSVLKEQYERGYEDAYLLTKNILFGYTFRVLYVVSLLFLWAAHIQVLLRLFYRHREKIWIKFIGGIITVLDVALWCASLFALKPHIPFNSSQDPLVSRHSAPASSHASSSSGELVRHSYLSHGYPAEIHTSGMTQYDPIHGQILILATVFDLILHLMYGVLVLVYTYRQRRFAYQLKHSLTVALSILSFVAPIMFLITCLIVFQSFLWCSLAALVAGAASTVVVWDWIDVVEYGIRKEQSSGVMGRQIYEKSIAGEFDKMSGTGGGQGATPGKLRQRSTSVSRSVDISRRHTSSLDPLSESLKFIWGWGTGLFRCKNKSPSTSEFSDSTGTEGVNSNSSNGPPSINDDPISPGSRSSPQVVFNTTALELSSPSPVDNPKKLKKFTYPVKRGKLRASRSSDSDENGDGDLYDTASDRENTSDDQQHEPSREPETHSNNPGLADGSSSAVYPTEGSSSAANPNIPSYSFSDDELPQFELVPGFDLGDYHDDKTPPPRHLDKQPQHQ